MADENLAALSNVEKLSPREAYLLGKYEESARAQENMAKMLQSYLWQSSTRSMMSGSIGAGSQIYYGLDPELMSSVAGLIGIGLGIVGFVVSNVLMGALGLVFGVTLLIAAAFLHWRQNKSPSSQRFGGT